MSLKNNGKIKSKNIKYTVKKIFIKSILVSYACEFMTLKLIVLKS